jgi:hypothetical protein
MSQKSLSSFRNVHMCASFADFRNICQNIATYITTGHDTYTYIWGKKIWESVMVMHYRLSLNIHTEHRGEKGYFYDRYISDLSTFYIN